MRSIPASHDLDRRATLEARPELVDGSRFGFSEHMRNSAVARAIGLALDRTRADVLLLDYGFVGQYAELARCRGIPVIIGTHNAQAQLGLQCLPPVRGPLGGARLAKCWLQWAAQHAHELRFFPLADRIVVVSENDADYHARFVTRSRIDVVPNFMAAPDASRGPEEDLIVMTGNFIASQNRVGALWFLEQVWCDALARRARLLFVGKASDVFLESLRGRISLDNVSATGMVSSVWPLLSRAKCSVVPVLQGSGTRYKCIEAMALGVPLLSTSKGCEGIEHDGFIVVADSAPRFRGSLCLLCDDAHRRQSMGAALRDVFERRYSLPRGADALEGCLRRVARSP